MTPDGQRRDHHRGRTGQARAEDRVAGDGRGDEVGAVPVDLAAAGDGNCALTQPAEIVTHGSATIHGPSNMPSLLAEHAREMYARNAFNFLQLLMVAEDGQDDVKPKDKKHKLEIDWDDEILTNSVLNHNGELVRAALENATTSGATTS